MFGSDYAGCIGNRARKLDFQKPWIIGNRSYFASLQVIRHEIDFYFCQLRQKVTRYYGIAMIGILRVNYK